jgi:predicted transcriptional regulator
MNVPKLRGKMTEKGVSVTKLAKNIGTSRATLYRKLNNGNITVSEATKIKDALNLTNVEARAIFFDR